MELRNARVKLVNMQPTDIVLVATSIANVAGSSAAKVISRGTAVSVPITTIDRSFVAICPGLRIGRLQRFKGVCVCVCACVRACVHALTCMCKCVSTNPETMSSKHSVSPEPSAYTKSTMSTDNSVSDDLSALTKPTCRAFRVLQAFSIY